MFSRFMYTVSGILTEDLIRNEICESISQCTVFKPKTKVEI